MKRDLKQLAAWFERSSRVLPWRENPDTYRVWISEIMLQQTQVITVIPYFEKFIARFPSVQALAEAPLDDVLFHWAGLGYYSRARNLHCAAQMIVERGFPKTRQEWLEIPGVGDYTAGAILSIAQNQVEAILDGNVERVVSRVWRVKRDAQYKDRLWELSRECVEGAHKCGIRPSVTNQALMELGATVCSPKKPKCGVCPLAELCEAHAAGEEESFPPKKKPKEWLAVSEKLQCCIDSSGRVLVRLREKGEWRAGLWDLPSKLPAELKPELIGEVESKHVVTRHKITRTTKVWLVPKRPWKAAESSENFRWVDPREPGVAIGSALKKTLSLVFERYRETLP